MRGRRHNEPNPLFWGNDFNFESVIFMFSFIFITTLQNNDYKHAN